MLQFVATIISLLIYICVLDEFIMNEAIVIPEERILKQIIVLRSVNVMLDLHLAELYGVETRALKQAVKRNLDRFP